MSKNDSHIPNDKTDHEGGSCIPQHHRIALGEKIDGIKDPYTGIGKTPNLIRNNQGKTY
jgi:hypothetical protein